MEWFPWPLTSRRVRAVWESTDRSEYICKHHRDVPEINPTQPKQTIHLDVNETQRSYMWRNRLNRVNLLKLSQKKKKKKRSVKVSSCSKTKRAECVDKLGIRRIKHVNLWTSEIKGGRSERGGKSSLPSQKAIFHSQLKHAAISPITVTGNSLGRRRLPRAFPHDRRNKTLLHLRANAALLWSLVVF